MTRVGFSHNSLLLSPFEPCHSFCQKTLLAGAALALAPAAFAQTAPAPATETAPKWEIYLEVGPKASVFRNVYQGTTLLDPSLGGPSDPYAREFYGRQHHISFCRRESLPADYAASAVRRFGGA